MRKAKKKSRKKSPNSIEAPAHEPVHLQMHAKSSFGYTPSNIMCCECVCAPWSLLQLCGTGMIKYHGLWAISYVFR